MGFQKKLVETLNKYGPKKTIFLPHFNEVLRKQLGSDQDLLIKQMN